MCGICGATGRDQAVDVRTMSAALVHRGPDDHGAFVDEHRGPQLAARRLSIIDVEGGHQPIQNEDGTITVVFNGEIYNYGQLRRHLLDRGHHLRTQADTEVLVHLYEDYGTALLHALEGMYAFALWDARRELLLLARDRFGEKPLFYLEREGGLVFASELQALVAGGGCCWDLDPEAIDDYFTFGYIAAPASIVRGVRQLPPGHALTWSRKRGVSLSSYWSPPEHATQLAGNVRELVEETHQLLDDSVKSRLVADVPVGVFLSGGVDSTLLAGLAARHAGKLKTFTVTYDTGDVGEGSAARRSARLVGADHHELVFTAADVRDCVPGYLAALDQPVADEALVALRAVSEFARRQVKVAVGGEGADEVFGGYPRYRWLARSLRLEGLPGSMRNAAAGVARTLSGRGRRLGALVAPVALSDRHVDWVTSGRRGFRTGIYGPRLREYALRESANGRPSASPNGSVEGVLMRLDQTHWLPGDVLAKADRASMQVSLELRTPYLHRGLVEFAATVPPSLHVKGGGKLLVRKVLERVVPDAAHRRGKVAFRTPTADWLRGPLSPALHEQLSSSALYEQGWFDRDAMRRLVDEHASGRADRTKVIWPVFVLGTWLDANASR
jgi:asparagine synthase (glutamine-hydrolysing)